MGWWREGREEGLGVESRGGEKVSGKWEGGELKEKHEGGSS